MVEPRIQYAKTSDGVSIAYYAIGEGSPYVWPSAPVGSHLADHWRIPEVRELFEAIASRTTLIAYGPRGFGLSDRGVMDYSCEAMVRDMEAVVEAATPEPFTLQTFGYMTVPALVYAARHPERVMALVLLNGVMRGADMAEGWRKLIRLASEDWEYASVLLAQTNDAGYTSTSTLEQVRRSTERAMSKEAFLAFSEEMEHWDASEFVNHIDSPALVVHYGSQSIHVSQEASRRLAAALPKGAFASVEPGERPDVIREAQSIVRSFLRGILPPNARRAVPAAPPSGMTAILFLDIAGSTELTSKLGDAAYRERERDLDAELRKAITDAGGTPVEGKVLGDGIMAVFSSARQAIDAARACRDLGNEAELPLHLGIHAGDVTREGNNVHGGAVQVASRVQSVAAPGEILVSQTVRDLARTSAGVAFEDRGEHELKGIEEPQRLFAVRGRDERS